MGLTLLWDSLRLLHAPPQSLVTTQPSRQRRTWGATRALAGRGRAPRQSGSSYMELFPRQRQAWSVFPEISKEVQGSLSQAQPGLDSTGLNTIRLLPGPRGRRQKRRRRPPVGSLPSPGSSAKDGSGWPWVGWWGSPGWAWALGRQERLRCMASTITAGEFGAVGSAWWMGACSGTGLQAACPFSKDKSWAKPSILWPPATRRRPALLGRIWGPAASSDVLSNCFCPFGLVCLLIHISVSQLRRLL